jgi:hypothetical protein
VTSRKGIDRSDPDCGGSDEPERPEVADAAVGPDEKKSEVDAVDADNLTEILDRLSQVPTPKTK